MKAITLVNACAREYNDAAFERITKPFWLDWLNDAQLAVVLVRPDASSSTENMQLVAGTKQTVPSGTLRLLGAVRNKGADGNTIGKTIRFVDRQTQDSVSRSWHMAAAGTLVNDIIYDDKKDPSTFWVNPPVPAGKLYVELELSKVPSEITDVDNGNIGLQDVYRSPLERWMMFRCYLLQTQAPGYFQKAISNFNSFFSLLGVKIKGEMFFAAAATGQFALPQAAQGGNR